MRCRDGDPQIGKGNRRDEVNPRVIGCLLPSCTRPGIVTADLEASRQYPPVTAPRKNRIDAQVGLTAQTLDQDINVSRRWLAIYTGHTNNVIQRTTEMLVGDCRTWLVCCATTASLGCGLRPARSGRRMSRWHVSVPRSMTGPGLGPMFASTGLRCSSRKHAHSRSNHNAATAQGAADLRLRELVAQQVPRRSENRPADRLWATCSSFLHESVRQYAHHVGLAAVGSPAVGDRPIVITAHSRHRTFRQ